MRFWRRRHPIEAPATDAAEIPGAALVPRVEKAVLALAVHARQLEDRITSLEERLADDREQTLDFATHDDVLDVRLHSAKLAGEIVRLNVELRAEIEKVANQQRVRPAPVATPEERRVRRLAEAIIDLDDRLYEGGAPVIELDPGVAGHDRRALADSA